MLQGYRTIIVAVLGLINAIAARFGVSPLPVEIPEDSDVVSWLITNVSPWVIMLIMRFVTKHPVGKIPPAALAIPLLMFGGFALTTLPGCASPVQVQPQNRGEQFQWAYVQIRDAYLQVRRMATPTVPGAKPLINKKQAQELKDDIDRAKALLDASFTIFLQGGAVQDPTNPSAAWAQQLRAVRVLMEEAQRG